MLKQNLHTHTAFCDGKNSVNELVEEAIKKNFTSLGFSGHGETISKEVSKMSAKAIQDYKQAVILAKQKYQNKIELFLGVEADVDGKRYLNEFDYVIGSCHTLKGYAIDSSEKKFLKLYQDIYQGDFYRLVEDYCKKIEVLANFPEVNIIGHLDIYGKYNESEKYFQFSDLKYLKRIYQLVDLLVAKGKIIEVNTGAIARGRRSLPYPHPLILQYMASKKAKIILNSDCHQKELLDCGYEKCLALLKELGFKEIFVLTSKGFIAKDIDLFES